MNNNDISKQDIIAPTIIQTPEITCIPPKLFKRNEYGLICDNDIKYIYNNEGDINWRKMISDKYLVPNRQLFEKNGKKVPASIDGLDDKELLILLAGIKQLAFIRGFTDVKYSIYSPSNDFVISTCSIKFIANYETEGKEIVFSSIGDANLNNTNSFGKYYLSAIAENRSFIRCVRNFLRIPIIGSDEINIPIPDGLSNPNTKITTSALLEIMNQNNITFEIIKSKLIKENFIDDNGIKAEDYTCINDIPSDKQFELIARIKKKAKLNV